MFIKLISGTDTITPKTIIHKGKGEKEFHNITHGSPVNGGKRIVLSLDKGMFPVIDSQPIELTGDDLSFFEMPDTYTNGIVDFILTKDNMYSHRKHCILLLEIPNNGYENVTYDIIKGGRELACGSYVKSINGKNYSVPQPIIEVNSDFILEWKGKFNNKEISQRIEYSVHASKWGISEIKGL
jgi:hypothetical protein